MCVCIRAVFQAESRKIKRLEETEEEGEQSIPKKKPRIDEQSSSSTLSSSLKGSTGKSKLSNLVKRKEPVKSQAQPTSKPHPSAQPTSNSLSLLSAYDDDDSDSN